ncbi:GAF domain-containing protein [Nocardioides scoriae]|uniref:GAF domain-containing protein n=1 Tax=Nocardioides scoriae TaxID=642780 RepID=UPI0012FB9BB3|nr:GAF domain-containing protein [Nocardioides scoriae]
MEPSPTTSWGGTDRAQRDALVASYVAAARRTSSLQRLAEEAAHVAEVPVVIVGLMTSTTQHTVAGVGAETNLIARRDALCGAVVDQGRRVHVPDASLDERWARNPYVDGRRARVRFYGSHPIVDPTGVVLGTLCVFDVRPRELDLRQAQALDALATRMAVVLERARHAAGESLAARPLVHA